MDRYAILLGKKSPKKLRVRPRAGKCPVCNERGNIVSGVISPVASLGMLHRVYPGGTAKHVLGSPATVCKKCGGTGEF